MSFHPVGQPGFAGRAQSDNQLGRGQGFGFVGAQLEAVQLAARGHKGLMPDSLTDEHLGPVIHDRETRDDLGGRGSGEQGGSDQRPEPNLEGQLKHER